MTVLFNRQVELTVGREGQEGRTIRDLRMEFQVEKSRESNPNPGSISIYNLSTVTRNIINDEGVKFELRAGYAGIGESPIIETLSKGDVLDVETQRRGPDIVTALKIGEGTKALTEKTLDKSYQEGASLKTIVGDMADELGIARGTIKGLTDTVFNSGYSASGKIKDRLDEILGKQGLDWNVQNGELQILPKDGSTDELAIFLDQNTGLLKAYKVKGELNGKKNLKDFIRFESLLNPRIKIGQKLQIVSAINEIDEVVTVRKVKYSGDNKDGRFICEGEAS